MSLLLNLNVFTAKIVYRFRRYSSYILSLIFVLKLNLTHSPLFVYKFAAKVPNMSSYQYLNNRNEWMAAFIVAESYENIHKFSQILAMYLFTKVKLYLFFFLFLANSSTLAAKLSILEAKS